MKDSELIANVQSAMYHQCQKRGYAAPVDVFMDIGVLPKQKYEEWRLGRVPYLEAVCTVNLSKLSLMMHQMRAYAQKAGWKPSVTCYQCRGGKKRMDKNGRLTSALRFSKSGAPGIETRYATHFVDVEQTARLKAGTGESEKVTDKNDR